MKSTYDTAVRDQVRKRMSPPNRESLAEIARSTWITTQTLSNWRSQWQKHGQLDMEAQLLKDLSHALLV